MLRLDYSGTGSSDGEFADGTLDAWLEEALAAIDRLTEGPLILVGSSMGGWIALHLALLRPERVQALVGIAAAPDFTDWGFARRREVGRARRASARALLGIGAATAAARREIAVDCPVRLVHGEHDGTCRSTSPSGPCARSVQPMSS